MNIYLLHNDNHPLDGSLEKALKQMEFNVEHLSLPFHHEDIVPLMTSIRGGIVFLPAIWTDLFCVKAIQEIQTLSGPFETVIYGPAPNSPELIVAFNEGLSAYLESPLEDEALKRVLSRTTARYKRKLDHERKTRLLENSESRNLSITSSPERFTRDRLLAKAFLDSLHGQGPLIGETGCVLLVSSSNAQRKRLETFLKEASIAVKCIDSMEEATKAAQNNPYTAIVSDSLLPDGDAVALATRLRNSMKSEFPRFVVWTSSPEKEKELLSPENPIDDVVLKSAPDAGMDSILISVIIALYQAEVT